MTNVFIQYEDEGRLKGFSFDPSSVTSLNVTKDSVRINQSLIVSLPEEAKRLVVKLVKENSQLKFIDVYGPKIGYSVITIWGSLAKKLLIFDNLESFDKACGLLEGSELIEVTSKSLDSLGIQVKSKNSSTVEALVHQVLGEST